MADRDVQLSMETARPAQEVGAAKTIVLFSDGTSNSSGRQQKTNVWRMYQTVDLGVPQQPDQQIQIGRYDNGIGNSAFRLLATLQGIFGWGLKRNLLSLYLFLCRNYRPGDSICLFGFSRGAYTVRVLADLIDKQGVIPCEHNGALDYLVREAYRSYRRGQRPRMLPMRWLVPMGKWAMRGLREIARVVRLRVRYRPEKNYKPQIDFLGLWDTVGAYGGPILEIVRGVDDWIMPISFTDKRLPPCVKAARHALALDDERDSFQSLPWNETGEARERLQQVWFAGMHSDVGGGYPDDSLSYVSFVWMLDEAKACASMRFRPDRELDARRQADPFGPIHNSRAGLAGYYRYQPRRISALMWPKGKGTESLSDPEQPDGQGMRRPALIHDSVFRRILSGTDRYAPISITRPYQIVRDRSAVPVLDLPEEHRRRFTDPRWQELQEAAQERVWDGVWKRRIVYFMIVIVSLALAFSPALILSTGAKTGSALGYLLRMPLRWLEALGIGPIPWLEAVASFPFLPLGLLVIIVLLFRLSGVLEKSLRKECRANWWAPRPSRDTEATPRSLICRFRSHWFYQDIIGFVRWNLLPSVFGIAMLLTLISSFASAGTIARLTWSERSDAFCPGDWPSAQPSRVDWLAADNPCNRTSLMVKRTQRYQVIFVVPEGQGWRDGAAAASPAGLAAGELLPFGVDWLFTMMRRHPDARWMQPLAHIVSQEGARHASWAQPIEIDPRREESPAGAVYRGTFTAGIDGRLALAVNEAIPTWPFRLGFFHDGRLSGSGRSWPHRNRGGACVLVAPAGTKVEPPDCAIGRR